MRILTRSSWNHTILGTLMLGLGAIFTTPSFAAPPGYTLFWSDEFNQGVNAQPNPATWRYDLGSGGWGNGEWQTYVNSWANCHIVADATATDQQALQIEVQTDSAGNYYSARINTSGNVFPQYGYVEARLRLPWSKGMWPAFWMLGQNIGTVSWPACGELDIMENIGSSPYTNIGSFHATGWDASATYDTPDKKWFKDQYHLFQANWTPNCITYYVDGVPFETRTVNEAANWPFNSPMFFILNLAVGGAFPGPPDGTTVVPMDYFIDYVRVYRLTAAPTNQVISLFAQASNAFVSADNAGTSPLIGNRTAANGWEQFQLVDLGSDNVALLSKANGKYVSADNAGNNPLIANRSSISTWETFRWEPHPDGTVSLKSLANNKYVCADKNLSNPPQLIANRTTAGAWESFGVTTYSEATAPTGAPVPPTGLTPTLSAGAIKLTWSKTPGATSYTLYRSTLPGGDGMAPIARGIRTTSFTHTGLKKGMKYFYTVSALNAKGMSLRSSIVSAIAR